MMRFFVSPDGKTATWFHPLDLSTGLYPQYDDWHDCTDMNDAEFEAFVFALQRAA